MTSIKICVILFILNFFSAFVEGGSLLRNIASRTSHPSRGRTIRVETRRLDKQMQEAKKFDQKAKKNQEQGFHDLANQNAKAKAEIEQKAELNRNNLVILGKKHPSKMTRTGSGRQQIVPAIAAKEKP